MAVPVAIPRISPTGFRLDDGYQTLLSIASQSGLDIWEKEVTPPGMDGGDPIDTTTMHNADYRTMSPRQLITLTEHTVVAAYDPCVYEVLLALVNVTDNFTVTLPDNSTLSYWAFIRSVEFSPHVEGEQPEMTITIVPTNYDDCNCVEAGPVMDCAGTCSC